MYELTGEYPLKAYFERTHNWSDASKAVRKFFKGNTDDPLDYLVTYNTGYDEVENLCYVDTTIFEKNCT